MATTLTAGPEPRRTADGPAARPGGVCLAALGGLVVTVAGMFIGLQPLRDNSFLTHLATGRLILGAGAVPSADPYSFTAPGEPWTVQSWLASVAYAGMEDLAGYLGIRLLIAGTAALLAYLLWRLTEPAGAVVARLGLVLPVLVIGADTWTERPMLFGLVGLALVWLLADGHGRAWWAVPLFWVWVNTHGSFPLGGALVATLLVGRCLDHRPGRRELQVLGWSVLGVLLGAVNPVGPRLVVFPLELLSKSEALGTIKEWQPPDYSELGPRLLLGLAVVAAVLFVRQRTFRQVLPAVVFLAAALIGARNVAPASIVLLAAMAPSLRGIGAEEGRAPRPVLGLAAVAVVAIAGLAAVSSLRGPHTDLVGYPTEAVAWMDDQGLLGPESRVVSRDFTGNYLEARYGTDVAVFMDDRYDLFPIPVIRDYRKLMDGDGDWAEVLERWGATAVLWDDHTELHGLLQEAEGWEVVHRDDRWIVAVPA